MFDNSYARLPPRFFAPSIPVVVSHPSLIKFNWPLAEELGFSQDTLNDEALADIFSGNQMLPGADPVAMVYAGHQFGNFVPTLGDGRALLLGEIVDKTGHRRDIHFKGSGRTPFSRHADGRSPLGPALREYIVSEAMHALGISTTRSLAVVGTGEMVQRDMPLPGAVLTRVANSHIRIGTFQYFAVRKDGEAVRILADYTIDRLYPHLREQDNPYLALLETVVARQADLIADWMSVGFIHGVMNTDNMTVSGETIDYGPCAFMDAYDPQTVYSAIDIRGRYAYGNQPSIAIWNLSRLAECLLPLLDTDQAKAVALAQHAVSSFAQRYEAVSLARFCRKAGIPVDADASRIILHLLELMERSQADFTLTFRALAMADEENDASALDALLGDVEGYGLWLTSWRQKRSVLRLDAKGSLKAVNPVYIPRNHLVEEALASAVAGDLAPLNRLIAVLAKPFAETEENARYALPPHPEERITNTFCGT